jgi:hypothetical protein
MATTTEAQVLAEAKRDKIAKEYERKVSSCIRRNVAAAKEKPISQGGMSNPTDEQELLFVLWERAGAPCARAEATKFYRELLSKEGFPSEDVDIDDIPGLGAKLKERILKFLNLQEARKRGDPHTPAGARARKAEEEAEALAKEIDRINDAIKTKKRLATIAKLQAVDEPGDAPDLTAAEAALVREAASTRPEEIGARTTPTPPEPDRFRSSFTTSAPRATTSFQPRPPSPSRRSDFDVGDDEVFGYDDISRAPDDRGR